MITQQVVLWVLGVVLSIILFLGSALFSVLGALLIAIYRTFNARIAKTEMDLDDLKMWLDKKIVSGNEAVLSSIKESSINSVHVNDCASRMKIMEQAHEFKLDINKNDHGRMDKTLNGILDTLEKVLKCLTNIQKKENCDL